MRVRIKRAEGDSQEFVGTRKRGRLAWAVFADSAREVLQLGPVGLFGSTDQTGFWFRGAVSPTRAVRCLVSQHLALN